MMDKVILIILFLWVVLWFLTLYDIYIISEKLLQQKRNLNKQ